MTKTIGLDVGGAHLKVAETRNGKLISARQVLCPLWRGLDELERALEFIKPIIRSADHVAITMTGELSDLFDTRKEGVHSLIDRLEKAYPAKTRYWIGERGFGTAQQARTHHTDVGSTNFLATAKSVAQHAPNAILIDMGSTTTDIIPIMDGKPCPIGISDAQRLQTGELVYTGLTRTSVMAVTDRVPVLGNWQSIAREHLATMADIYRLLGELPEGVDVHDTADGRGKSHAESLARFARMLGRDAADMHLIKQHDDHEVSAWKPAAQFVKAQQLESIEHSVYQVVSAQPGMDNPLIVTAGIGADLIRKIALRLHLPSTTFGALLADHLSDARSITHNAPAAAVALLAANDK